LVSGRFSNGLTPCLVRSLSEFVPLAGAGTCEY
jgi:hypothetical protein